jgi:hypothetical protein
VDREAEHVDRGLEQIGVDPVPEERCGLIGLDQVPETVDGQRRVRLVCLQQPGERLAQRSHHLAVVGLLQVGRSEAPCEQQAVALGDRQVEVLGEVDKELAARARAAGLDEAEGLVERFASSANSICVSRRWARQKRMSSPTVCGSLSVWTVVTAPTVTLAQIARSPRM